MLHSCSVHLYIAYPFASFPIQPVSVWLSDPASGQSICLTACKWPKHSSSGTPVPLEWRKKEFIFSFLYFRSSLVNVLVLVVFLTA